MRSRLNTPRANCAGYRGAMIVVGLFVLIAGCRESDDAAWMCVSDGQCNAAATCNDGRCVPRDECDPGALNCSCHEGLCNAGGRCEFDMCVSCDPGSVECVCHEGLCNVGGRCERNVCVACDPGSLNCACHEGLCNVGLVCSDRRCVSVGGDRDAGIPDAGSPDVGIGPSDTGRPDGGRDSGLDAGPPDTGRDLGVDSAADGRSDSDGLTAGEAVEAYLAAIRDGEVERCGCYYEELGFDSPTECVTTSHENASYDRCAESWLLDRRNALRDALCLLEVELDYVSCATEADCDPEAVDRCSSIWEEGSADCSAYALLQTACVDEQPEPALCADGELVLPSQLCDGIEQCADGSDEDMHCFVCESRHGRVPWDAVCDGVEDCRDGLDEALCFVCEDGDGEVPFTDRCDGVPGCEDASDESADCEPIPCWYGAADEVPRAWHCDGIADCGEYGYEEYGCMPGGVVCDDGWKVARWDVCDGEADCEDGRDERDCPSDLVCDGSATQLHPCDGLEDCRGLDCSSAVCGDAVCGEDEHSSTCADCLCVHGDEEACAVGQVCVGGERLDIFDPQPIGICHAPWGTRFRIRRISATILDEYYDLGILRNRFPDTIANISVEFRTVAGELAEEAVCSLDRVTNDLEPEWFPDGGCSFIVYEGESLIVRLLDDDSRIPFASDPDYIFGLRLPHDPASLQRVSNTWLTRESETLSIEFEPVAY